MLAYLFWHRPEENADITAYEQALVRFHRSLAHTPPAGLERSATFRAPALAWLASGGYEDWYLLDDWSAVGVLRQAAVSQGHLTAHDQVARHFGSGAGGIYRLCEGVAILRQAASATWVTPARAPAEPGAGELLGDGLRAGSLWRRELVLGPAPEFCVLAPEPPPGIDERRLPAGWQSTTTARQLLWSTD